MAACYRQHQTITGKDNENADAKVSEQKELYAICHALWQLRKAAIDTRPRGDQRGMEKRDVKCSQGADSIQIVQLEAAGRHICYRQILLDLLEGGSHQTKLVRCRTGKNPLGDPSSEEMNDVSQHTLQFESLIHVLDASSKHQCSDGICFR